MAKEDVMPAADELSAEPVVETAAEAAPTSEQADDAWADEVQESDGSELEAKRKERQAQQEADDAAFEEGWGLSMDTEEKKEPELTFAQAFAQARANGEKAFTWRGKRYATQLKGEVKAPPAPAATPAAAPVAAPPANAVGAVDDKPGRALKPASTAGAVKSPAPMGGNLK